MKNNHITYIEFKTSDLQKTKAFYQQAFAWNFTDYGPSYASFSGAGVNGGFEQSEEKVENGALVVMYNDNLEGSEKAVIEAGGKISKAIFSFPGGRRFHFLDPTGNELAVWSDQ